MQQNINTIYCTSISLFWNTAFLPKKVYGVDT